ncbi:MAG: TonB-dependent receptor [Muribaculaceae bacterium]
MKRKLLLVFTMLLVVMATFAQAKVTVNGVVTDDANEPLIGASVIVAGTSNGTMTDIDGKYSMSNVPANATISISYVGLRTAEVKVNGQKVINVKLKDGALKLDDVVVIGYGTAKAKDLTSPITVVKGDEISSIATTSPMSALQGKVAGVSVVNSGAPGDGPKVSVRGLGSFSNSDPLYVVDGMFFDNINFLNNSDIESMSVLKDASASAIYGVRAANGVVIITTKKGLKNQKAKITYDGYVGVQTASNVIKMANSKEYSTMMLEANYADYSSYIKNSIDKFGGSYADADFHNWTIGSNTNWYNELLRTAIITNHSLNISGGSEKASYAVGGNYLYQDGIMDTENNYSRFNLRASVDFEATNWLKVGANMVMSNSNQKTPNSNAWQQAFNMPGLIPVYDKDNADATPNKYAAPSTLGLTSNFYNPVATANYNNNRNKVFQILPSAFLEFTFIPGKLKFKTSFSEDYRVITNREYTPVYKVSNYQKNDVSKLSKKTETYNNYIWDNTLTYWDKFGDHGLTVMLGHSLRQESYQFLKGTASNVPGDKDEYLYLNQGDVTGRTVEDGAHTYRGVSFFGRASYDYAGKYMLNVTMRADGSQKYNEKWGYFPSVGAAWIISKENFMRDLSWVNFLKLRGSWGMLGNDHIAASDGFRQVVTNNGTSGVFGDALIPGSQTSSNFSWLSWEVVKEANVGINFVTLNNRLDVDLDYYYRLTDKAVINTTIPLTTTSIAGNNGQIATSGFELGVNWHENVNKDFSYNVGATMTTLRNRVENLNGAKWIKGGGGGVTSVINTVGQQMNSYYGYKVEGVYQSAAEIAADKVAQNMIKSGVALEPGDFKYEDYNHDGVITSDDNQILGSNIPTFSYGFNIGMRYRHFEFSLAAQGVTGNKIFNRKRALRYAQPNYNFDQDMYENRWTGEGTSNTYCSSKAMTKGWNNNNTSSFFVESGAYFRIQNINIAYNIPNVRLGNYVIPNIRLSANADRPFTAFTANSFSPETTDSYGWDANVYPLSSTYTFGLRIDF